jgi:hypothetical protein
MNVMWLRDKLGEEGRRRGGIEIAVGRSQGTFNISQMAVS